MRAFLHYYITVNLINICFSLLVAIVALHWFPIMFATGGILVGVLAYHTFFKNQYYFYHNLGYTKSRLIVITFALNLMPALLLLTLIKML
jgi:hypothetical protein